MLVTFSSRSDSTKSCTAGRIVLSTGLILYRLSLDCFPSVLLPPAANYKLRVGEHAMVEAGISPNLMLLDVLSDIL